MKIVYRILIVVSSILSIMGLTACGSSYDSSPANPPSTGGLVINEIDYDQSGADTLEFIEIHNSSSVAISLTYVVLELVNGATDAVYETYNLASGASSIAPGGYLVLRNSAVTVAGGAIEMPLPDASIQNGGTDPDGLRLVDTLGLTVIDGLAYEGTMVGTGETGGATLVDISTEPDSSLARCPNGQDTDDNDSDFVVTTPTTPGADNNCI